MPLQPISGTVVDQAGVISYTNRNKIERLASAKYDSSDFATYANGVVVSIVAQDWVLFATDASGNPVHLKEVAEKVETLTGNVSPMVRKLPLR